MRLADLDDHVEHVRARCLQEALAGATGHHWHRRAGELEGCKPRPDEYQGRSTDAGLSAAWHRNDARARACRNAAVVAEWYDPKEVIADRLEEYARWLDMQRFERAGVAA